jgi:multidrug resistance efflux pump
MSVGEKNILSNKEIVIRSEEVQEILTHVPNWMVRWGNTLILILIIGLLLISWFVKYPDTIASEIIVTTSIPPEKIYANNSGQIDTILVGNNDNVSKNQILAIIENSSNYHDVIILKEITDTLKVNYKNFYFPIEKIPFLLLGDIESDYANFETSYTEYLLNKQLKPISNEFLANQISLSEAKNRLNIIISQQKINKKEIEIKRNDLDRYESLFKKGVISAQDFDLKKLEYLQAQRDYQNNISSISQLRDLINNAKKNLKGTEIKKIQEENKYLKNVIQSYNRLKKSLKKWELSYVLKSSIDGKVSFLSFWNKNQSVTQGDLVFTVIPGGSNSFIGKIKAPIENSGKIKIGQKVNIRLANYPNSEFGMLEGKVENISSLPDSEGYYLIDVILPEQLITTYDKKIKFKQEMRGSAEIITENLRLIERFFYQLKEIFKR